MFGGIVTDQLCVLCGVNPASTGQGDHIPPKGIYTKAERRDAKYQFHTVPACIECNGNGSSHDEILKVAIAFNTGEYRGHDEEIINALASTTVKNRKIGKKIFDSARQVTAETRSGIRVPMVAIDIDVDAYRASVSRICRAMYWRVTGSILDKDSDIIVIPTNQLDSGQASIVKQALMTESPTIVNGGTFACKLVNLGGGLELMALEFFGKHTVLASIDTPQT